MERILHPGLHEYGSVQAPQLASERLHLKRVMYILERTSNGKANHKTREDTMLKQVHEHIVSELQQNARTDTIFVVTAIAFNLIVLGINSAVAGEAESGRADLSNDLILAVFITMSLLVNFVATIALNTGRKSREKLIQGILSMYRDNDVAKYYDASLVEGYSKRYQLLTGIIIALALSGILVPLIIRFL
jgi:hypothetical protein